MLGSASLTTRFLIAPILGVILTLILYLSSNKVIEDNAKLFQDLSKTNLVQISEINQISILLTDSNSEIISLLLESDNLDEEEIYVQGKTQLNQLYDIEKRLTNTLDEQSHLIINDIDIFKQIKSAFFQYRQEAISAIEMSSVNAKQATYELVLANKKLKILNTLFFKLSEYYADELSKQSQLVEGTLYKKTYITELGIGLMILMLWSAFYFSRKTSKALTQVYDALIHLSKGNTKVEVHHNKDAYIKDIWTAVEEFKGSVKSNEIYKNDLLIQKFAMDQHAIIAVTDIHGKIIYVNSKFCEISGYSENELLGNNHRILNSGNQKKGYWHNMYQCVSQGNVWQDEVKNRNKSGGYYWVDTTIIPMTSAESKKQITGYISIRTDITQKKIQHDKLVEANTMAQSAVVAKSQFLATMSHEIRTPMNGVIGMLDLLLNDTLTKTQMHHATLAQTSAQSLLTLINDILDFSKIDANKLELERHNFDLTSLLEDFSSFMRFQAQEKKLSLSLNTHFEQTSVMADSGRLRQILTNIVGNAIKFTKTGSISIDANLTSLCDSNWLFTCTITDTGIGIDTKDLPKLFDSFSQTDVSNSRKYGGTGLGLAISKRLASLMNGDITVKSELNIGTCFTCIVQLGKSKKPIISKERKEAKTILEPQWPNKHGVLLVEDNPINQVVALNILKRFGLTADVANHGIEALHKLKQNSDCYQVILMDCQMPQMDGYETTKNIRENKDGSLNSNIPIIAMTANAMIGDRENCLKSGMNDYLTKPIEPEALLETLQKWLLNS